MLEWVYGKYTTSSYTVTITYPYSFSNKAVTQSHLVLGSSTDSYGIRANSTGKSSVVVVCSFTISGTAIASIIIGY